VREVTKKVHHSGVWDFSIFRTFVFGRSSHRIFEWYRIEQLIILPSRKETFLKHLYLVEALVENVISSKGRAESPRKPPTFPLLLLLAFLRSRLSPHTLNAPRSLTLPHIFPPLSTDASNTLPTLAATLALTASRRLSRIAFFSSSSSSASEDGSSGLLRFLVCMLLASVASSRLGGEGAAVGWRRRDSLLCVDVDAKERKSNNIEHNIFWQNH
jgi:hypothetical protein